MLPLDFDRAFAARIRSGAKRTYCRRGWAGRASRDHASKHAEKRFIVEAKSST
jgi:hypothetical protein